MMQSAKVITCPAYLIAGTNDGHAFHTIESRGEKWFPVYHERELAEEQMQQTGGTIQTVTDEADFQSILIDNPLIAGFLVNNPAQRDLFSPVTRIQLVAK